MLNYYELDKLIDDFMKELENIRFEKTEEMNHGSNSNKTTFNYIDNSWNIFNRSILYDTPKKHGEKEDGEKEDGENENSKSQEGNHPIIFLMTSSALSLGATYLIATDEYRNVRNKFKILDEIMNKITDKTKNTTIEYHTYNIKINYENLKNSIIKQISPKYYSKLGIIGSSFVTLTYFYPFGTLALFPGIIALTGFGCYWLWNHLTCDEYTNIQSSHHKIFQNLNALKQETYFSISHQYQYDPSIHTSNDTANDIFPLNCSSKYSIKYILSDPSIYSNIQQSAPLHIL